MKTKKELEKELSELKDEISSWEKFNEKKNTKMRKRIPFLQTCIRYMESNPTRDFCKKELDRIENKINLRMLLFPLDDYKEKNLDKPTVSKLKKEFEKKHEIPHLREQARTLRFLLK